MTEASRFMMIKLKHIQILKSFYLSAHTDRFIEMNHRTTNYWHFMECLFAFSVRKKKKSTSFAHILHYTKYNTFFFRIRNFVHYLPSSLCVAMQLQHRKATFQAHVFCITLFSTLTVPSDGQGTRCSFNPSGQLNVWTRKYKITTMEGAKTIRRIRWQVDCETGCSSKTESCYCSLSQFVKHETNEVVQNSALSKQNIWLDCKR